MAQGLILNLYLFKQKMFSNQVSRLHFVLPNAWLRKLLVWLFITVLDI